MASNGSPSASRAGRLALPALLLLAFLVFLNGNHSVGLFETSEARYAEVAREMAASGDYLTPRLNGVSHFTKPPLTYWITAIGYHLFGQGNFGARFFLAVAACLVVFLTARVHALVCRGSGLLAAALLLCSMAFFSLAKVLTTDMFLCLWVTAGVWLYALREAGRLPPRAFGPIFGVLAALAFLTKGPVGLLFWGVVLLPHALWSKGWRALRGCWSPSFWLPFLALSIPWFWVMGAKHTGLLDYLLHHESTEAAVSSARFHPGGWFYYLPVLLGGLFPWWISIVFRWRSFAKRETRLWLLWALVPLALWSLFPAKLPTYILPAFPAWALLAAWAIEEGRGVTRPLGAALSGAAALLPCAAIAYLFWSPRPLPSAGAAAWSLLALSALAGIAGASASFRRPRAGLAAAMAVVVLFELAVPFLCRDLEEVLKIKAPLGQAIAARREPGDGILEYKVTLHSIPFYTKGLVAAYEAGFTRKKFVSDVPPNILKTPEELRAYLQKHPALWVVTDRSGEKDLHGEIAGLLLVMRHGRHSLWATQPALSRAGAARKRRD